MISKPNIIGIVWQTVRRITIEILRVKESNNTVGECAFIFDVQFSRLYFSRIRKAYITTDHFHLLVK